MTDLQKYHRLTKILLIGTVLLFIFFWIGGPIYYQTSRWFLWIYLAMGFGAAFSCLYCCSTYDNERRKESEVKKEKKLKDWQAWIESLSDAELLSYEGLNCTDEQYKIVSRNVWGRWKKLADHNPKFINYCDETAIKALRYLARNPRPSYGQSEFNSEHLYQIADELEKSVKNIK